jgi:hypothetical protein
MSARTDEQQYVKTKRKRRLPGRENRVDVFYMLLFSIPPLPVYAKISNRFDHGAVISRFYF